MRISKNNRDEKIIDVKVDNKIEKPEDETVLAMMKASVKKLASKLVKVAQK